MPIIEADGTDGKRVFGDGEQRQIQEESHGYGYSQIGVHDLVPKLGYREYWYPAIEAWKVGIRSWWFFGRRRPVSVKMLGEDVLLFPGKNKKVAAIWNRCPHRGAIFTPKGRCEFDGTVSCPYHGYTFDETGTCVAALTEGPNSGQVGKMKVRSYPTAVVHGVVFVWMGQTEPVPIEEDLPEVLLDKRYAVNHFRSIWPMNWSITLENNADSHDAHIHRFRVKRILNLLAFREKPAYWTGTRIIEKTDKSIGINPVIHGPKQGYYPGIGKKWPQHVWWLFLRGRRRGENNFLGKPFSNQYRLPSITYVDVGGGMLQNQYATPIDEDHCIMFQFYTMRGDTQWRRLWAWLYTHTWGWYSGTDGTNRLEDIGTNRYDRLDTSAPQKLGANDAHIIYWRRRMPLQSRDAQRLWDKGTLRRLEENSPLGEELETKVEVR